MRLGALLACVAVLVTVSTCSCAGPRLAAGPMIDEAAAPTAFLAATDVIDAGHPEVVRVAREVTGGATSDREKAVRLHDHVRDEVLFGFQSRFYAVRASEVLEAGVGYCNTKSTLFVALLRAAGVPARQRFVDIDAGILRGITSPPGSMVDHSFTEVWLDGRWVATDSYIVDPGLMSVARAKLEAEGRSLGYGAHVRGTNEWDGATDAFSQFVDPENTSTRDFGVHSDVMAFYRDTPDARDRRGVLLRWFGGWLFGSATRKAAELRATAGTEPRRRS